MKRSHCNLLIACFAFVFCAAAVSAAEPSQHLLTPAQFAKFRSLIKPGSKEEKWTEIPWLTDLWEARKRALAQGKPILLWEMDGHPLGCT